MTLIRWTVNQKLNLRHMLYCLLLWLHPPPTNLQFSKILHIYLLLPCQLRLVFHLLPPISVHDAFLLWTSHDVEHSLQPAFFNQQRSWSRLQFFSINIKKFASIINWRFDWKIVRYDTSYEERIQQNQQKSYSRQIASTRYTH